MQRLKRQIHYYEEDRFCRINRTVYENNLGNTQFLGLSYSGI